ncbi:TetR/AcrR family transcriptional regulator [Nesterenkonia sp. MY13]|uniref:TetR/AcrR family transcriptional regulator n=1 Tax=Nesterenkonia sedimenti TaxID=1463632 RepID=A0A7X8YDK7_9MICC|nr:TetR/AcrR family transcriptional regulator [Nesterenkonia sedimenti]NLS09476.1 TetR/AcrR family transcriptional regulator [Nesterenkonia sedimenti]
MGTRSEAKENTRQQLLQAAKDVVSSQGPTALSLRDVARRAGVVPSAVYRHFESRDALLTQLILYAYTGLAEHLETAVASSEGHGAWRTAANALRAWALANRHEFLLIYGTPVPGYRAPEATISAAVRVAAVFISRTPQEAGPPADPTLRKQLTAPAADFGVSADGLAHALAEVSQLVGALILELGGHFVGTADPADQLWDHILTRQSLGGTG